MTRPATFRLVQQTHRVTPKKGNVGWKTGQGFLTVWTPDMVANAPDPVLAWAEYAQQILGVPWPTQNDQVLLRKRTNEFFDRYPRADWYTLCRLVGWCKNRKKRDPRVWMVLDRFRAAWVAGALPELDPSSIEPSVEARIERALETETNETWRRLLLGAVGPQARRGAIEAWETEGKASHGIP